MRISEESGLAEQIDWFLDYLQGERGASSHTIAAYQRDLHEAATFLAKRTRANWSDFDSVLSSEFRAFLGSKRLSPSTIQRKIAALRSLLKFLSNRGRYDGRLPDTGGLRKAKALPKSLTAPQIEALLAAPDITEPAGVRDRAMLELLYGTGLRVSELVEMRMENYSAAESLLRVFGKRGKTRLVPLPAVTHDWLRLYLEEARPKLSKKPGSDMFLNQRGRRISRSGVFRILQDYSCAAGIEQGVSPHTLRHSYAVHLVQAGADLRSVQELLGHASIATTEVYTHLDMETLRKKYLDAHPRAKK